MTLYRPSQIAKWRKQAKEANLHDHQILNKYNDIELAEIFNGIGSDGFPEWLRQGYSKLHPSLMPVALIHDVQWHERSLQKIDNPGKIDRHKFELTNQQFKWNSDLMAKYNYSWYNPARYYVHFAGWRFKHYCNTNLGYHWWKA